jgi:hypothetical protein
VIKAVKRWTGLNAGCLLDHWDGRTDSVEMVRSLIPVSFSPAHPRESGDPVVSRGTMFCIASNAQPIQPGTQETGSPLSRG